MDARAPFSEIAPLETLSLGAPGESRRKRDFGRRTARGFRIRACLTPLASSLLFRIRFISALSLFPLLLAATTSPTTNPASRAAAPVLQAVFDKDGVKFCYPPSWAPKTPNTTELTVAAPRPALHGYATLTLDVPSLPPFVPLFISAERVEDGYVKNLRKGEIPDAKVDQSAAITVCGCKGRCVKCSGTLKSIPQVDVAVILVHSHKVYILSCDSDGANYAQARAALDEAVKSLAWTK